MPELPEVETIRQSLQDTIIGKTIRGIEVRKSKIFVGNPKGVVGRKIEKIERRGKVLIIKLSGEVSLLVHFKMTGQVVWVPRAGQRVTVGHPIPFADSELPAKTTHVIFTIDDGKLFYNDLRQFGWIKIVQNSKLSTQKEIASLGPEPLDFSCDKPFTNKEFTKDYLKQIFSKSSKPVKLVLMDQTKIAGIGNIYANDALFEAGIMPTRPARTLREKEIERIKDAIIRVLTDGLMYGGSSAADEAYIKPTGEPGSYQKHFRVYQRDGGSCSHCRRIIQRAKIGGRGTFFCLRCQR
jgi:formamidopyrimidine-DNA glycosylase